MLNLNKLRKDNKLIINLNDDNLDYYLKKTKKIIHFCDRKKITIEKAINLKNKEDRYNYIYDTVCSYLDKKIATNYCEFIDDICIRDRLKNNNHKNGCCECKGRGKCKYLINSVCTMKSCMACKLFTCKTLRDRGIVEKINDYSLIKYFFTSKQKDILRFSYWTPKEIVIDRLLKNKYVRP